MTVAEFITAINKTIPSPEQIIEKYKWDSSELSVQKALKVQSEHKVPIKNIIDRHSELEYLMYNMNEVQFQIGSIVFRREIRVVHEHFQWFATYNDYERICLNDEDGCIVWIEGSSEESADLAVSLSQFLYFMSIYDRYNKHLVWGLNFSKYLLAAELHKLIEEGLNEWFINTLIHDWPWDDNVGNVSK